MGVLQGKLGIHKVIAFCGLLVARNVEHASHVNISFLDFKPDFKVLIPKL